MNPKPNPNADPNSMRNKFIKFVKEVLRQALVHGGVPWTPRIPFPEETSSFFTAEFAGDLYRYSVAIDMEFALFTRAIPIKTFQDTHTLRQFMDNAEAECFRATPTMLRGALKYMAYMVDLCIYLYRINRTSQVVEHVVQRIGLVYDLYLSPLFTDDGAFQSLHEELQRRLEDLRNPAGPSEDAAKGYK